MIDVVAVTTYGICCTGYLALSVAASARREPGKGALFLVASLATALWAGSVVASLTGNLPPLAVQFAEISRDAAWFYLLLTLWGYLVRGRTRMSRRAPTTSIIPPLFLAALAVAAAPDLGFLAPYDWLVQPIHRVVPVIIPVFGMLAVENILRNSGPSGRWGIKYLSLGIATIFAFDFFLYSDALLLRTTDQNLIAARGLITALAAPLLAISLPRIHSWAHEGEAEIVASHKMALHSVALAGSGLYLLTMAALAFYIREIGGRWGVVLQFGFMIGVLLLLAMVFVSGKVKSQLKITVQKYFFTYKYDYREEWLRFIQAMSAHQLLPLGERLVHALANMMDSPAGALWVWRPLDSAYVLDAAWNYHGARASEGANSPVLAILRQSGGPVEIRDFRAPRSPANDGLSGWILGHEQGWILVPLIHRGEVLAFLLLDEARAPRSLDWEDRDLLRTTAAQAASYLAEELSAAALSDAQRLEEFNRRFAFVVHDIKNVVGQMSLMLGNAERFGHDEEFQKDLMDTVRNSVLRMKKLLEQLSAKRRSQPPGIASVDLSAFLLASVARWRKTVPRVTGDISAAAMPAMAIGDDLVSVLDLVIDNAVGATADTGTVEVKLRAEGGEAVITVEDDGAGMDMEFVRKELFSPLRTTKSSGYGIGAFQTRHLIHGMGGRLEVDSAPNRGTVVRIILPLAVSASLTASA